MNARTPRPWSGLSTALVAAASCALLVLSQMAPAAETTAAFDASSDPAGPLRGPPASPAFSNLPDMGSSANALISRADEFQLGRMMLKELRDQGQLLEDPETSEYIQNVGLSVGAQAQDGNTRFNFFVVRDRAINAFAIPGGFIVVHSGLILQTANESELASVLGHEIGHVVQRHIARRVEQQGRLSLPTMAAVLGAILIGAIGGGGDATAGIIAAAQGGAAQAGINFSRMEEQEADRLGIGFLTAASYDPSAMASFFETVSREEGLAMKDVPEMLLVHPVTRERVAEAKARASQLPRVSHTDSLGYALIRERLRVITAASDQDLRPYYVTALRNATPAERLSLRYGAALAAMQAGDPASAVTSLRELVAQNQGLTILHSALGQAQMKAGQHDAALATFAHANSLFPRNIPIAVRYSEALIDAGKPAQAHALLLDLFNNVAPTPDQIHLTALAASAAGDTGDAYYYMSEYQIASGDLNLASQQLELALAAPKITAIQRKRFVARLEEIRGVLREQRGKRGQR